MQNMPPGAETTTPEAQRTRDLIIHRIIERTGGREPTCPICGEHRFAVGAYSPIPVTPTANILMMGRFQPAVTVICMTCGGVQFINLMMLGFTLEDIANMPNDG